MGRRDNIACIRRILMCRTVLLAFVVCGGMFFELARIVPEIWGYIASLFTRWTS